MKRSIGNLLFLVIIVALASACATAPDWAPATQGSYNALSRQVAALQQDVRDAQTTGRRALEAANAASTKVGKVEEDHARTAELLRQTNESLSTYRAENDQKVEKLGADVKSLNGITGTLTTTVSAKADRTVVDTAVATLTTKVDGDMSKLTRRVNYVQVKARDAHDRTVVLGADPANYMIIGSFPVAVLNANGDELKAGAKLSKELEAQIKQLADALAAGREIASIEAYADPRDFPGKTKEESAEWNKKASELRGEAVKAELLKFTYDSDQAKQDAIEAAIEAITVEDRGATSKFANLDRNRVVVVRFK